MWNEYDPLGPLPPPPNPLFKLMGWVGKHSLSTSVVTVTEQQTTAKNPVLVPYASDLNLTVISPVELVTGPGSGPQQNFPVNDPLEIST